jgi:hypothetical protein
VPYRARLTGALPITEKVKPVPAARVTAGGRVMVKADVPESKMILPAVLLCNVEELE